MLKGGASDVGAHQLAKLCAEAERIKPFEVTETLARDKLITVRSALGETQAAFLRYQNSRLRTDHG
jgi:two-component system sensor histidine kinase RpfC